MSNLLTYSPEDITILLAGVIPIDGYVDGTFLSIKKDVDPYSSKTTADDVVSRTYRKNQSYTITLTLHSASASNDILTTLWQLDELTQTAKFPIIIKDQLGTSFFFSSTSWIEGVAEMTYGTEITERRWVIKSSQAILNVGGNDGESSLIGDLARTLLAASPILGSLL